MAVITPSTDLYLLKVPLEIDEMNQLDFADATAQYNYFSTLPKLIVDDFTYQRKDFTVRFPACYDEIVTYNYVMYRNDAYSNKWFYAFITDMEYVNDNMTKITIKNDPWQCWQFDLHYRPCLIDREHANTDVAGDNILPEGLELGEMVCNGNPENFEYNHSYCIVVEVSQIENQGDGGTLSHEWEDGGGVEWDSTPTINGMIRGTTPLIVEYNDTTAPDLDSLRELYDKAGLGEAIVNIYPLPRVLQTYDGANIDSHLLTLKVTDSFGSEIRRVEHIRVLKSSSTVVPIGTHSFNKPTTLANFSPKNQKLLTYPYCYFNISNNSGTSIPFHYEDFSTSNVNFNVEGVFCLGGSIKAIPQYYKNISSDTLKYGNKLDFSVSGGKYPVGSWKSDSYTNWLTQNSVNMETQWRGTAISAATDLIGGIATGFAAGGTVGAAVGGIGGAIGAGKEIIGTAREQHLAKTSANFVPDQVHGNVSAGDFVWSKYRTPFTFMPMCIKPQIAQCIDEYFSQFGYKCNRVKLPNVKGRRNWNFVKTVGCYIDGDVPQADLQEIKDMFDRGVTIWHNPIFFGNYGADNDIIV